MHTYSRLQSTTYTKYVGDFKKIGDNVFWRIYPPIAMIYRIVSPYNWVHNFNNTKSIH